MVVRPMHLNRLAVIYIRRCLPNMARCTVRAKGRSGACL